MGTPATKPEFAIREVCDAHSPVLAPWQSITQDKDAWDTMDIYVARDHATVFRGR